MNEVHRDTNKMEFEDDEPEILFESGTQKKWRTEASTTHPDPVTIEVDDEDEVEELSAFYSCPNPEHRRRSKDQETVILSDSEDDIKDNTEFEYTLDTSKEGEYGDVPVGDDYENSEVLDVTPPEVLEAAKKRQADDFKKVGNDFFVRGEYQQAVLMYTKAIAFVPTEAAFYGNRSACYLVLRKYREAQEDAKTSVEVDPLFGKGYLRLLKATLALGEVKKAETMVEVLKNQVPPGVIGAPFFEEEIKLIKLKKILDEFAATKAKGDFRKLLFLCERALEIADGDLQLKVTKAEALVHLNRASEAQEICMDVLRQDSRCVEAYYFRAICFFLSDNTDKALQFIRHGLQFQPDNPLLLGIFKKIKRLRESREEGSKLFSSGKYAEAETIFNNCLQQLTEFGFPNTTVESKMSLNVSLIALKLGRVDEALEKVNHAVKLNPSYLKAILHRATVHKQKGMWDEAVRDYESAQKLDPRDPAYRKYVNETKLIAKKANRKDYYKILGIDKNVSQDDIKKAYKKRALIHHPDRHSNASEAVQKEQEKQFKDLGQAYEVLSDPKKRSRYDAGHDLVEESYGNDFDANNLFNVFFGNSGGGGGMGSASFHGFQQHGRPHSSYTYSSNFHPY